MQRFLRGSQFYSICFCFTSFRKLNLFSVHTTSSSILKSTYSLANYLRETLNLPEKDALLVSKRFSAYKTIKDPHVVISYLRGAGFSDTQISYIARVSPTTLFSDVDKTLRPKLLYFQEMGIVGPDLCSFITKNSSVLTVSLNKRIIPCVEILKNVLLKDDGGRFLIRVLHRGRAILLKDPKLYLETNILYLESCGIVGVQLSSLLKQQPWLFVTKESALKNFVSRVIALGVSTDSKMFVHALLTVCGLSPRSFQTKVELFQNLGFSEDQCVDMFRRAPCLLRMSAKKINLSVAFFVNTLKREITSLFRNPRYLMFSLEHRTIPRHRLLEALMARNLLKTKPNFNGVLNLTEDDFRKKFLLNFADHREELLAIYMDRCF